MPGLADAAVDYGLQADCLSPDYNPGICSYPSKGHCHAKPKLQFGNSQFIYNKIWTCNLWLRTVVIVNCPITSTRINVISLAGILMARCTIAVVLNVTWPSCCKI